MQTEHKDVRKFLGAFAKLRKATDIFVMSVRPSIRTEQLGSKIFTKFDICVFLETLSRKFKFY
jgi:hypothetical protein